MMKHPSSWLCSFKNRRLESPHLQGPAKVNKVDTDEPRPELTTQTRRAGSTVVASLVPPRWCLVLHYARDRSGHTCFEETESKSLLIDSNKTLQAQPRFQEISSYAVRDKTLTRKPRESLMWLTATNPHCPILHGLQG